MDKTLKAAVKILHQSGFQVKNRKGLIKNTEIAVEHDDDTIKKACQRVDRARGYRYNQKIDSDDEIVF